MRIPLVSTWITIQRWSPCFWKSIPSVTSLRRREFWFGIVGFCRFLLRVELPILDYVYFGYNAGENFYYITITKTSNKVVGVQPMLDDGNSFHSVGSVFIGMLFGWFLSCRGVRSDVYRFLRAQYCLTNWHRSYSTPLTHVLMHLPLVCCERVLFLFRRFRFGWRAQSE